MFWNPEVSSGARCLNVQCRQYNNQPFTKPSTPRFLVPGTCVSTFITFSDMLLQMLKSLEHMHIPRSYPKAFDAQSQSAAAALCRSVVTVAFQTKETAIFLQGMGHVHCSFQVVYCFRFVQFSDPSHEPACQFLCKWLFSASASGHFCGVVRCAASFYPCTPTTP